IEPAAGEAPGPVCRDERRDEPPRRVLRDAAIEAQAMDLARGAKPRQGLLGRLELVDDRGPGGVDRRGRRGAFDLEQERRAHRARAAPPDLGCRVGRSGRGHGRQGHAYGAPEAPVVALVAGAPPEVRGRLTLGSDTVAGIALLTPSIVPTLVARAAR